MDDALIFDWNRDAPEQRPAQILLLDETLRDGLQSPSVRAPTIEQKLRILHLLDRIGIDTSARAPSASMRKIGRWTICSAAPRRRSLSASATA